MPYVNLQGLQETSQSISSGQYQSNCPLDPYWSLQVITGKLQPLASSFSQENNSFPVTSFNQEYLSKY